MSKEILGRFTDLVVSNSSRQVLELSQKLRNLPLAEQRAHFGGEHHSGFFYLFRSDKHPGVVMETVVSAAGGDGVTSLYLDHRENATIGAVIAARQALINALSQRVGLSADAIGIDDATRGRTLGVTELSTGQLIDLLAERVGKTVLTTGSHGGDVEVGVEAIA